MESLSVYLQRETWIWTWGQLGTAFLLLVAAFIVRSVLIARLSVAIHKLTARTETEVDDLAARAILGPLGWLVIWIGIYLAFMTLARGFSNLTLYADRAFKVLVTGVLAWALFRLVDALALALQEFSARTDNKLDDQLAPLVRKAAKAMVALMAFVLVVQNLGYSVTGLLAGLGLGGLAFALAAKDTIANLFGSVTIFVDHPFRVGDWITTGDTDGVVEEIGLRSTRVRTFAKTLVSIPNQNLTNTTVENHSLMPKRRVKMTIGVTYDTPAAKMRRLVERIEAYLAGREDVHQEFKLVKFTTFADSSLEVFIYYFSVTTDWAAHLQVRQDVNLGIMEIVEDLGLSMAFPTRTVHLAGRDPD